MEFRSDMSVELIQANASEEMAAHAAWVSSKGVAAETQDTGRIEGLINFLVREGHTSPLEHGSFTFMIEAPIFVARQFMTHKKWWSINEQSGRYKEFEPVFYVPGESRPLVQTGKMGAYAFEQGNDSQKFWSRDSHRQVAGQAWAFYQAMLSQGIAKEVARNVLPVSTYTSFYASANPLGVLYFLKERLHPTAQDEIREVARQIELFVLQTIPITHIAWAKYQMEYDD